MASPSFKINGGGLNAKASVAAGGAIQAVLNDISGVWSVVWSVPRTDDTTTGSSYTLVQSGGVGQQVDFTALTAGTAGILQATINAGRDTLTGETSLTMTQTVKFYVPTVEGLEVLCVGELEDANRESDLTFGGVVPLNAVIRNGGKLGDFKPSVRLATVAALPAYTASGSGPTKKLTMNAPAVLTIDGVATVLGNRILHKTAAASHVDHGIYTVTTEGTGAVAAVLTRADESNISAEMTAAHIVPVEEGTVNADQTFICTTNNPITLDTTALTYANWGVVAPLVTTLLRGTVTPLGAASTVLTTDGATAGGAWAKLVDANVDAAAAIAGTKISPDFGSQQVLTTGSVLVQNAAGWVGVGTVPGGGGGSGVNVRASVGRLRLPFGDANGGVNFRGVVDASDYCGITAQVVAGFGASAIVINGAYPTRAVSTFIDAASYVAFATAGIARFYLSSTSFEVTVPIFRWVTATVAPVFTQEPDSGGGAVGDKFTIKAQNTTNAGATEAGPLALEPGEATNGPHGSVEIGLSHTRTTKKAAQVAIGADADMTAYGELVHASGQFAADGDAQVSRFVLRNQSINGAAVDLRADGTAELVTFEADASYAIDAVVVARDVGVGVAFARYTVQALVDRQSAGNATLVWSNVATDFETVAGWALAISVHGAAAQELNLTFTGAAGETVNAVAYVRITKVQG